MQPSLSPQAAKRLAQGRGLHFKCSRSLLPLLGWLVILGLRRTLVLLRSPA
jgi:hypothetical protein